MAFFPDLLYLRTCWFSDVYNKYQINDLHSYKLLPYFNNAGIILATFFWMSCTFACICYIKTSSANSGFFQLVQFFIDFTFSAIFQNRWNIIFIIIFINELSPSCLQWIYWTFCLFFFSLSWGKGVGSSRVLSNSGVFTIKLSSSFSLSLDDVSLLSNMFPWFSLSKSNNPMLCQHYEIVWPVDIFPFTLLYSVLYYLSKK